MTGLNRGAASAPALVRSLRMMTLGTLQAYNDRQDEYESQALGEVDRQFQLKFSGGDGKGVVSFDAGGSPVRDGNTGAGVGVVHREVLPDPVFEPDSLVGVYSLGATADDDDTIVAEVWATQAITFVTPFIDGREDRDPPFQYPLFTYGAQLDQGSRIVIECHVTSWHADEDYVTGCEIEIGAFRTDPTMPLGDFVGTLHLNFQGRASAQPPEPNPEEEGTVDA